MTEKMFYIFICLLNRFLRKEKDISLAKLEVVQAEANRMKQKLEFLEKQVEELSQTLNQERTQQQVSYVSIILLIFIVIELSNLLGLLCDETLYYSVSFVVLLNLCCNCQVED